MALVASPHSITTRVVPADAHGITTAVSLLAAGEIVAIPTETVYGLAADARNPDAVAAIYVAKGRPAINPLIVHVTGVDMAARYGMFSPLARRLAERFWPGALTLVTPLAEHAPVAAAVTAGLPAIALRVPAHPVMQAVIAGLDRGVAAPSANASGRLSPTSAAHVAGSLEGRIPLIIDGGPTRAGIESTIVAVTDHGLRLLRHGAIPLEDIAAAIGTKIPVAAEGEAVAAPGMLLRHYAPRLPVVLDVIDGTPDSFHIGFGAISGDRNLSAAGDLAEAARNLFALLHEAEASGRQRIEVAPIPDSGPGRAITDRLRRAARG